MIVAFAYIVGFIRLARGGRGGVENSQIVDLLRLMIKVTCMGLGMSLRSGNKLFLYGFRLQDAG